MKIFIPILCSLLLIGCNDTTKMSAPENTTGGSETATVPTPTTVAEKPNISSTTTVAPMTAAIDGGALFAQKCASCHGTKAEKSALGKSQIIATFSEQQIKDALHGYQSGTYGKEMKALMQGQVKPLSDEQIGVLAKYISAL